MFVEQIILWNKNGEANQKGRESKKSLQKVEGGHCHILSHKLKLRWGTISFVEHLNVPFNAISWFLEKRVHENYHNAEST